MISGDTMPIIEIKNLSYTYGIGTPFQKTAIKNINVSIEKGEFIGIIGHTGSGKSTLIQHLNGLLKPSEGKVILNGNDIWKNPKNINNIRFKVGLVFQYPEYQLFESTVYKDIAFGPKNMGLCKEEIEKRVLYSIDFVGLNKAILDKSPFEISGGEKRRTAIAGILAMDPDVLILDEPTAGLDPGSRKSIMQQIKIYHEKRNNTILFISHNMEDIASFADKVIVLNNGELIMFGNTKDVFSKKNELKSYGLGLPNITFIAESLREKGYDIPPGILTLDQCLEEIEKFLEHKGDKIG